jgi:hypothetical protein
MQPLAIRARPKVQRTSTSGDVTLESLPASAESAMMTGASTPRDCTSVGEGNLNSMTKNQLKDVCRSLQLPVSGRKVAWLCVQAIDVFLG